MFSGCTTALVTPFRAGRVDLEGLRQNVRFQLSAGVSGLLACGSTGEAPTLSPAEWQQVVETVGTLCRRKARLVVGAGTNNTEKSVKQAKLAEKLGADAILVVAPYYNKPTQEGLYRHFRAIAEAVSVPLIVYNIPPRSVVNILPATLERLCRDCANITMVKEASGSLDQVSEIVARCGDRITVLSGDDSLTLPMMAVGARGVISVVSNIVPADVEKMVRLYLSGKTKPAAALHLRLFPLIKAMFIESNPIPVKAALGMLGMASGEPRLPLCPPSDASLATVRKALREYGLLTA